MKQITANFGAIKDTIYKFASKQLVNEDTKTPILQIFLKEVKENAILKLQYLIYKNLESGHYKKERLAERYVQQNLKLIENFNWSDILAANKQLRFNLLAEGHVEGSAGKTELYEHIHTLIRSVTQKGFTDIDRAQEAYDFVLENLMKEKVETPITESVKTENEVDHPKFLSWKFVTQLALNDLENEFQTLNENEQEVVSILLSPVENKMNYLKDLKNENLEQIDSIMSKHNDTPDADLSSTLTGFKFKINSLKESVMDPSQIDEAIINLVELKSMLSSEDNFISE